MMRLRTGAPNGSYISVRKAFDCLPICDIRSVATREMCSLFFSYWQKWRDGHRRTMKEWQQLPYNRTDKMLQRRLKWINLYWASKGTLENLKQRFKAFERRSLLGVLSEGNAHTTIMNDLCNAKIRNYMPNNIQSSLYWGIQESRSSSKKSVHLIQLQLQWETLYNPQILY